MRALPLIRDVIVRQIVGAVVGAGVKPAPTVCPPCVFLRDPDGSNERLLTIDPRLNPGAGVDPYLDAMLMGWRRRGPWLDSGWSKD